jgi:hypothetical protein
MRSHLVQIVVLLTLTTAPTTAASGDERLDGPGLAAHLESLSELMAMRLGGELPILDEADYATLAAGEAVIRQQEMEGSDVLGATVFDVCDVEAWRIWLAICDRDHHEEFMPHIREGVCLADFGHSRLVYQYLALPAIHDRHWVIRTRTNGPLWQRSGQAIWESSWALEPDADALIERYVESGAIEKISASQADDAIVTPRNDGCWLLVDLPDGHCYVAYQDLSDIGGRVPAWLVNELGPSGLADLVQKVEERARQIEHFFSADRPPPAAPDGTRVEQLVIDPG